MHSSEIPSGRRTAPCSNPTCDEEVLITKPSKSGYHFCTRKAECQAARQRMLRNFSSDTPKARLLQGAQALIHALVTRERVQCAECGLTNALPGYVHPDSAGDACGGVGSTPYGDKDFGALAARTIWPLGGAVWEAEKRPATM